MAIKKSVKKDCGNQCGSYPNCYSCGDKTKVNNTIKKGTPDLRATKVTIKKPTAQLATKNKVKPTADSTAVYKDQFTTQFDLAKIAAKYGKKDLANEYAKKGTEAKKAEFRQALKGKPGFDKNGYPVKLIKEKKGGSIKSKKK